MDLKERTFQYSIDIIRYMDSLPKAKVHYSIINQLIRSGTSVGANFRASQRAKSDKDFLYKLKIVEEELDESMFWLELIERVLDFEIDNQRSKLYNEADQILAIIVTIIKKIRRKLNP